MQTMNDDREIEELVRQYEELFVRRHQAAIEELLAPHEALFVELTSQYIDIILGVVFAQYKAVIDDVSTEYMRALREELDGK